MDIVTFADVLGDRGGLEMLHRDLSAALAERGHRVSLLYAETGNREEEWRELTEGRMLRSSLSLGRRLRPNRLWSAVKTAADSRQFRADVVWVQQYEHLELAQLIGAVRRAPVVAHLHLRGPSTLGPVGRLVVRGVDRWIAISEAVAQEWVNAGVPRRRVDVVTNGVDVSFFRPVSDRDIVALRERWAIRSDAYVVLYAGRLRTHKGAGVAVAALEALRERYPEAILLVAGGGADGPVPGDAVRVLGFQPRHAVRELMQLCDVLVVPTTEFDGFPLSVLEGLACGRPVVASAVGGIPEQLTGRLAALLVPPNDVDALAQKLAALRHWRVADPGLGEACREHVVTRHRIEATVNGVEASLSAAASEHGQATRDRP